VERHVREPDVVTFVRTVLGDIDPSALGVTYAHEHLVIDHGRATALFPDFLLEDVERMATEVAEAAALGLRAVVDAMPADTGRNATKLADLSRRTGVHIVASTGLHHERFYGPAHWSSRLGEAELAELFRADVEDGIDAHDYSGPVVRRTPHKAGVVKVAGSDVGPSARDTPIFIAAAEAHRRTGVPILTHCENGTGALEQVRLLVDYGVPAGHIVLSHVDKVVDTRYHAELLATGAYAEYDQSFRWGDAPNGTLALIDAMTGAGLADRIVLGMDAARQGYYRAYGGSPGLAYLLDGFSRAMTERGLGAATWRALFIDNPSRAFAFAPPASVPIGAASGASATTNATPSATGRPS
jgi:predicted metal-dependent phosphotriesterase family hydrolase